MLYQNKPCEIVSLSRSLGVAVIRQDDRLLAVPETELEQEEPKKKTRAGKKTTGPAPQGDE